MVTLLLLEESLLIERVENIIYRVIDFPAKNEARDYDKYGGLTLSH